MSAKLTRRYEQFVRRVAHVPMSPRLQTLNGLCDEGVGVVSAASLKDLLFNQIASVLGRCSFGKSGAERKSSGPPNEVEIQFGLN